MESVQRAAGLPVSSGVAALKEVIGHERDMVLARCGQICALMTGSWCGWEGSAALFSDHPASHGLLTMLSGSSGCWPRLLHCTCSCLVVP